MIAEPPAEAWATARQKRERRQETKDADDLAMIEWYESLHALLLDPATGKPWRGKYGHRGRVAKELDVDYDTLRYIERVDTAHLRRELEQRQAARRAAP